MLERVGLPFGTYRVFASQTDGVSPKVSQEVKAIHLTRENPISSLDLVLGVNRSTVIVKTEDGASVVGAQLSPSPSSVLAAMRFRGRGQTSRRVSGHLSTRSRNTYRAHTSKSCCPEISCRSVVSFLWTRRST